MVDPKDHDHVDEDTSIASDLEDVSVKGPVEQQAADTDPEDDDETWTNQPASRSSEDADGSLEDDDLEDEEDEEDEEEQQPAVRKLIQNGRDVVCDELPVRASRAKQRLRPYLTGTMVIELIDRKERYLFDWRGDEPKVSLVEGAVSLANGETSDASKVDCIVALSEQNLMAVRSGVLNPQLAMLADKIKVQGRVSPAVYLFNLIAPRERY